MKRKIMTVLGLILGVALILSSVYFYFFSGKTLFSSDTIEINAPETTTTRMLDLKESGNPYKITMDVTYNIARDTGANEYRLFQYTTALLNDRKEVIEQNSSSYTYRVDRGEDAENPVGDKSNTITLLSLKDVPTDTYAISIIITPNVALDRVISLRNFSYAVKSNVIPVHPALPITGVILVIVSYAFLPRTKAAIQQETTDDKK